MMKSLKVQYYDENEQYCYFKMVDGEVLGQFVSPLGLNCMVFKQPQGLQLLYEGSGLTDQIINPTDGEWKYMTDTEFNPTVDECMNFLSEEYPSGIPTDIVECIKKYFK